MGFSRPPAVPPIPPPPPLLQQPSGELAAKSQTARAKGAQGMASTIKTGFDGVTTPAKTTQATLLGG